MTDQTDYARDPWTVAIWAGLALVLTLWAAAALVDWCRLAT